MPFDVASWIRSRFPRAKFTSTGWARMCCPFHPDSTPSFGIHIGSGNYGCRAASCGAKGGLVRLIKEIDDLSWREAFALVDRPNPFDVDAVEDPAPAVPRPPTHNELPGFLTPVSTERFPSYLIGRGFHYDDVQPFGLLFAESGPSRGDLFFPFWDLDGAYKTYKMRRMQEGARYADPESGLASKMLYGVWRLASTRTDRVFVVEGQFDVIRMWSLGLPAVGLSTCRTTAAQRNQLAELHHVFSLQVYIMLDAGEMETESAHGIAASLSCQGIAATVLTVPAGIKDPGELEYSHVPLILDACNQTR